MFISPTCRGRMLGEIKSSWMIVIVMSALSSNECLNGISTSASYELCKKAVWEQGEGGKDEDSADDTGSSSEVLMEYPLIFGFLRRRLNTFGVETWVARWVRGMKSGSEGESVEGCE